MFVVYFDQQTGALFAIARRNHLFLHLNKFFCIFQSLTIKRKKKGKPHKNMHEYSSWTIFPGVDLSPDSQDHYIKT